MGKQQSGTAGARTSAGASGRERLLKAAAAEFSRHGYAGASIAGISGAAGVSKSTVFHHFPSKQALYIEVISQAAAEFGRIMDQLLADHPDPADGLAAFQLEHLKHIDRNREVVRLVLRELQEASDEHKESLIVRVLAENFGRLRRYLEHARQAGRIRESVDTEIAALLLFSANIFFFQYGGVLDQLPGLNVAGSRDRFARTVVNIVHEGLKVPAKPES